MRVFVLERERKTEIEQSAGMCASPLKTHRQHQTNNNKSGKAQRKTHNYESMRSAWANGLMKVAVQGGGERYEEAAENGAGQLLTGLSCHLTFARGRLTLFQALFCRLFRVNDMQTNTEKKETQNAQGKVKGNNKLDRKYAQYTKTQLRIRGRKGESERKLKKSTEYFARDLRQ